MTTLLSVVGSTATGKTNLALWLASQQLSDKKYTGIDLISADSRQVYKGLEIISGADIPSGFKTQSLLELPHSFFENDQIALHGQSILNPDQEWSVVHFQEFAQKIIQRSWQQNRLPILVGGTALYHLQLFNPELALQPGPNQELRLELDSKTTPELQNLAQKLDPTHFNQMNESDRANPRRLVRVIEKAKQAADSPKSMTLNSDLEIKAADQHFILGLQIDFEILSQRIKDRVGQRWQGGALEEVKSFLSNYDQDKLPSASTTGVAEIKQFFEGSLTESEAKELWAQRELKYAKEQTRWWQRESEVKWFEALSSDLQSQVQTALASIQN